MNDFQTSLDAFLAKCNATFEAVNAASTMKHYGPVRVDEGSKNLKIVRTNPDGQGGGVFCFIDKKDGTILKAAGWKAPAKGARGNIFDHSTYEKMDAYGGWLYLR